MEGMLLGLHKDAEDEVPGLFKCTNDGSTGVRGHFRPACLPDIFSYRFSQDFFEKFVKNSRNFWKIH